MPQETDDKSGRTTEQVSSHPQNIYYLMIGLLWASSFFPEARLWGVNWYRYFSWPGQGLLMLLGLGLPLFIGSFSQRLDNRLQTKPDSTGQTFSRMLLVSVPIVSGLLFWILRGRTHFLGDGYQVLAKLQAGPEVIKPWDNVIWTIQKSIYQLFGPGEPAALAALQLLSIVCGVVFTIIILVASRRLFASNLERLLFLLIVATGGYMLLFFGYVENYPLFVLAVGSFALTGLLITRRIWPKWALALPLAASLALHPFGVSLLPAALYVWFDSSPLAQKWNRLRPHLKYALVAIPTVIGVLGIYQLWTLNYFFRFAFVPPVTDPFTVDGYTMFSFDHLADFGNLLLMLAAGCLPIVVMIAGSRFRECMRKPDYRFLALLSITSLALIFVMNPRLGMPRDWDLFCFAGLPVVLFFAWVLLDNRNKLTGRAAVAMLVISLNLILLGPRVASQVHEATSIEVFDYFAELDVTKSRNGRFLLQEYLERHDRMDEHHRRAVANAAALPHERLQSAGLKLGDDGHLLEAIAKFRQSLRYDPGYHYAWANLGVVYRWMERYDSAITCLRIADGLNPYSFSTYMKLGGTYHGAGDFEPAEKYWKRAVNLKKDDLECRAFLLSLYKDQGRLAEYETLLAEVIGIEDTPPELLLDAARNELARNHPDSARQLLARALGIGVDSAIIRDLQDEFRELWPLDTDTTRTIN